MQLTPVQIPSPTTAAQAKEARQRLDPVLRAGTSDSVRLRPEGGGRRETVTVPRAAFELFLAVLEQMSRGNAVSLVPIHAELTTQQAADLLHVSRPYLIGLLEAGALPFHRVGSHRRIKAADLFAYKRTRDQEVHAALDELTAEAQKLGLDY